ncbi:MAG: BamA/TamA family outer membrane protein, partial [Melioribacteraceae bacterium]|nr:BamA/TamA family outer membrane protein [Melioribacteraceae bacterium]
MKINFLKTIIFLSLILINLAVPNISILGQNEKRIELVNIDFSGNDYFDTSELENIIISKESSWWGSQFLNSFTSIGSPATYFDSLDIVDDIEILQNYYKSNGFFKVQIAHEYKITKTKKSEANLKYQIIENERSTIRKYQLEGLSDLPEILAKQMNGLIDFDSTDYYSEYLVESNNIIVTNFLRDKGYMLVQASTPIVEIDTLANVVDVSVKFNLGNRYRISEVKVEKSGPGEDLVSNELITDIANISKEKFYNYSDLKLAQIRLYRTNLFSSAVIAGSLQDTNKNYVPVNIITKVGLLNELSPELIVINEESNFKFGLGLTYSNKNFLGNARKLTIGASAAAQNITEFIKEANLASKNIFGYIDSRIGFEQPFLLGRPINTLLEGFYTLEKRKDQWNAKIYGAKLRLNFELPQYIYLTTLSTYLTWQNSNYIFQEEYLVDKLSGKLPDSLITGDWTSNTTTAILGVQLSANKTDDFLFPTSGYSISILAEDGNSIPLLISKVTNGSFKETAYNKIVITFTGYLPFTKNIFDSFGTKLKIGNIHSYQGNLNSIPPNQRFTSGGSNSVRGWQAYELPIESYNITSIPENFTKDDFDNIARNITPG